MTDRHSKEKRSYNMSRVKSKDTKPEVFVRKYLFAAGFRYRKNDKRLQGHPDIVLSKHKTVIFINGCFWHQHENCKYAAFPKTNKEFWMEKLKGNKQRDEEKVKQLEADGWKVVVVWTCELKPKTIQNKMIWLCSEIVK
ncbi:MAG: DNA mismatch endonuclease Vsr [Candidatus Bathyarchaeota archaeon]|nr:DNA mismatch endonuclease Vsr [Candidatus Termiticorpusculum sp.]